VKIILIIFCLLFFSQVIAQDASYLKVHFLYGSKPIRKYKATEPKWFGGILGGHVGIEAETGEILSFVPKGKFHWFPKNRSKHSSYVIHSTSQFYLMFGGNADSVKKAIVYIPVTAAQKQSFDSIATIYLRETPYDYAFFGVRCAAAAHDILGNLKILPDYSIRKTSRKIFYPRRLRNELFETAKERGWEVIRSGGSSTRRWDKK
jgi:hypothetical protein